MTASDRITLDGHVINKVGTLQLAVAAHAFGVPFHALCHGPDPAAATAADVLSAAAPASWPRCRCG